MSTLEERRAERVVVTKGQLTDLFVRGFKYGFITSSVMAVGAFMLGMLAASP